MTREIKFRAWDNLNGVMMWCTPAFIIPSVWDDPNTYIMQFTGLKDKNGKEIYEGDLVRTINWKPNTHIEVKWLKDRCGFNIQPRKSVTAQWEIIGNIYENPELLAHKEE